MQYRSLGSTNLQVSSLAFGAGPVPAVMTGADHSQQVQLVRAAMDAGINWFDTAATYGAGASERHLGAAFAELKATAQVHVATKVRLLGDDLQDISGAVRRSIEHSLERLQMPRVTLLQLHNSITRQRGDLPTSLSVEDVLRDGGVADALEQIRHDGLAAHIGLTGLGDATSLRTVIESGRFETIQIPLSLANPTASRVPASGFDEENLGQVIRTCASRGMGVFAIRVYAGGALAQLPPSEHTLKTPFFPLALYQRDCQRARAMDSVLANEMSPPEAGLRFALFEPGVTAAIVGFSQPEHIEQAIKWSERGPLTSSLIEQLLRCSYRPAAELSNHEW